MCDSEAHFTLQDVLKVMAQTQGTLTISIKSRENIF